MKLVKSNKRTEKKNKVKDILLSVLTGLFVAVFIFSSYKLWTIYKTYKQGDEVYGELDSSVGTVIDEDEPEIDYSEMTEEQIEVVRKSLYEQLEDIGADFDALSGINDDVVGWIKIAGTNINYPVVQTKDNSYYLKHTFDKAKSSVGCPFLDCENSSAFADKNNIIYGHKLNNKTMFHNVILYENQSYYDSHPYGTLITPDGNYIIEFFSGYITDVYASAWDLEFSSEEEYGEWLEEITAKSLFTAQITPDTSDRVVTLSTCSKAFENARFVLHGVLRQSAAND